MKIQELLDTWEISQPILIGKYKAIKDKSFGFFNEIRTCDDRHIKYPGQSEIVNDVYVKNSNLENGAYYQFYFCLASAEECKKRSNKYLIQGDANKDLIKIKKITNQYEQIINRLFQETGSTTRDAVNLSRALKKIAGDLYTESERFIFEILQNADDFPSQSGRVKVHFILLQEYFLILHNGKPFNDREVEAISSIGDSTKETDSSKTGYKGIGFKSVFADADCVYIFSGGYQFRYDRSHYENSEETPWEIKPIWTEKNHLPIEIEQCPDFSEYSVAIALHVGVDKINEYKRKLKQLFTEPRFMLFLRHVQLINVSGLSQDLKLSLQLKRNNDFSQILYNSKLKNNWLSKDFDFDVDQTVKDKIQNDQKVPKKLKEATKTKLSFAVKLESNNLVSLTSNESVLFTYLPTNVKDYQFPVLVNADFLTTANRQDLHRDNEWNGFIFQQIGYLFFDFIAWICTEYPEYRNHIVKLIPEKISINETTAACFNKGFEKGLHDIAFIPSDEIGNLLKVSEAILDETGIIKTIDSARIKSALGIDKYFVSHDLLCSQKLKSLGVETFDFSSLCDFLKSGLNFNEYITLLEVINKKRYTKQIKRNSIAIIWLENRSYISPEKSSIYFRPSSDDRQLLTFDNFNFIHPDLQTICNTNKAVDDCLRELGVTEFEPISLIKNRLKKNQYKPFNDKIKNYINYIRFIFKYRDQLTVQEYQFLKNIQLLYKTNDKYFSSEASSCYLSDYYRPDYLLESITDDLSQNSFKFIISDYCKSHSDIDEWRKFFLKIHTIKPDGIEIIKRIIIPMIKNHKINENNTIKITQFIYKVLKGKEIPNELKRELSHLLLRTNDGLQEAHNCNFTDFYTNSSQNLKLLNEIKLKNLISVDYCDEGQSRESWRQFFISIGVQEKYGIELLKHKISLLTKDSTLVTAENAVFITTEILYYYKELSEDDFNNLKKLPVLLKNNQLAPADRCYLSNDYQPIQNLEDLFATIDCNEIVSNKYISHNNDKVLWKNFFLKIGVAEELKIIPITKNLISAEDELFKAYRQFIGVGDLSNSQISDFDSFAIKKILNCNRNYQFSIKLWTYLAEHWGRLRLEDNSKIRINQDTPRTVISLFKFIVTQYLRSIPCLDQQCYEPGKVYSASLANELNGLDLLISAINLPAKVEDFLGIKRTLDINAYLKLLSSGENHHTLKIYKSISEIINKGVNIQDKNLLLEYRKTGKILACDDQLHPISEMYYLDSNLSLPFKRNSKLVKYSENCQSFYDSVGVKKITKQDIRPVSKNNKTCNVLHNLIKQRVDLISMYLVNTTDIEVIRNQSKKILKCLDDLTIYNSEKLYCCIEKINYNEPIYNYYNENHNIDYVEKWNNRKNARIGEYLIRELELSNRKISSERLLDFLDDPIEESIQYFRESGFKDLKAIFDNLIFDDTQAINDIGQQQPDRTLARTSVISNPDGTGKDPECWGNFGENQAKSFYEDLGYDVAKQPDVMGYDFLCKKSNDQLYVEVKTINPKYSG
ncbi:sacsin N-terminal ATP-binding-like domain-containing protein [Picosynechococcus sp. PCC 7117]|uniref:sacsin N-terminal ATP-binding-like domain-containing protein n=1 Tax=Picosynechococcus sp. PCC 7117 TaxID=195498 RepID=UPI000810B8FC|nr:hypothetical protein [Picosynechococcus sp. PCC 7117]ANV87533.1 hypothetical protein AWQ22_08730 [Picosynechococcus sp. PCC 7117]